jgi:hypothetical protein
MYTKRPISLMEPPTQGNDKAQQRRPEYKYIDTYIYIYLAIYRAAAI